MSITTLIHRFQKGLHRFRAAQGGNVLITFTLLLIPIIGLVGAAVDYSRAASARTAMQGAVDSTALMLSKDASTLTPAQINTKATAYFNAMFNRPDVTGIQITPIYTSSGGAQIVVTGAGSVPTSFMKVMGISTMNISVSSTVRWGNTRLRVALVLDTTGSMSNAGKMAALKAATENLLKQLQAAAANDGDVYVSIIPFSKNVNLDPTNYTATWIDWTDWEAEPAVVNSDQAKPTGRAPDRVRPVPLPTPTKGSFARPARPTTARRPLRFRRLGTYKGYICPSVDSGRKSPTKIGIYYNGCYNSTTYTCTGSFLYLHRPLPTAPAPAAAARRTASSQPATSSTPGSRTRTAAPGTAASPIAALQRPQTRTTIERSRHRAQASPLRCFRRNKTPIARRIVKALNYDWSAMKTMVDALYPLGATNQPIGLVWGWQSLVGGGPLTMPAKDSGYTYNEVIVLMSDGLNTLDRWYGNGSTTNTSVDKRMYESTTLGTCANIKAAGITIYTVHVNTDGDPMSTLLKNCASTADKFWMVTSAE